MTTYDQEVYNSEKEKNSLLTGSNVRQKVWLEVKAKNTLEKKIKEIKY